jgi:hypothetical protein
MAYILIISAELKTPKMIHSRDFFFFGLGSTSFWTQGLMLARQALYHLLKPCLQPFLL